MISAINIIGGILAGVVGSGTFWAYIQNRKSRKLGIDGDTTAARVQQSADWQAFVDKLHHQIEIQDEKIRQQDIRIFEQGKRIEEISSTVVQLSLENQYLKQHITVTLQSELPETI